MGNWGDTLDEVNAAEQEQPGRGLDIVRKSKLAELSQYTGRDTILYATNFMAPAQSGLNGEIHAITVEDVQGFMTVLSGSENAALDLILHTPGGSVEATELIVRYLRQKYEHIRVIVPVQAMSAGTLMALAADVIVLGRHSSLGPIDPQMLMHMSGGSARYVPAQGIISNFEEAAEDVRDNDMAVLTWTPVLEQYYPGLLDECRAAIDLSRLLVQDWLCRWMLRDEPQRVPTARAIAEYLNNFSERKTHARPIMYPELHDLGVKLERLEDDDDLQDRVLSAFHATTITFDHAEVEKIIENARGESYLKHVGSVPGTQARLVEAMQMLLDAGFGADNGADALGGRPESKDAVHDARLPDAAE